MADKKKKRKGKTPVDKFNGWTAQQMARRNALAEHLLEKLSLRKAGAKVKEELQLKTYSTQTMHADYHALLEEWRKLRVEVTDETIGKELAEIELLQRELWLAWLDSKEKYKRMRLTEKGVPSGKDGTKTKTISSQRTFEDVKQYGNVQYLHEYSELSKERRKLLGMYAAEKREVTGNVTFADTMMQAALTERQTKGKDGKLQDLAADGQPVNWDEI